MIGFGGVLWSEQLGLFFSCLFLIELSVVIVCSWLAIIKGAVVIG